MKNEKKERMKKWKKEERKVRVDKGRNASATQCRCQGGLLPTFQMVWLVEVNKHFAAQWINGVRITKKTDYRIKQLTSVVMDERNVEIKEIQEKIIRKYVT